MKKKATTELIKLIGTMSDKEAESLLESLKDANTIKLNNIK